MESICAFDLRPRSGYEVVIARTTNHVGNYHVRNYHAFLSSLGRGKDQVVVFLMWPRLKKPEFQHGTLVSENMDQHPHTPSCLILRHMCSPRAAGVLCKIVALMNWVLTLAFPVNTIQQRAPPSLLGGPYSIWPWVKSPVIPQ